MIHRLRSKLRFAFLAGALLASSFAASHVYAIDVPTVQFSSTTYRVVEADAALISVTRTGNSSGIVTVDYALTPDDAAADTNLDAVSGTLTFADGETSGTINVPTIDNHNITPSHTASLVLSRPIGADLGTPSTAKLTITDLNDRDGDGFSNEVEVAAGTDPEDIASTPFGGAPAGAPSLMTVGKLAVKLNFAKPVMNDSISFSGSFPNTLVTMPPGTAFIVQLGHVRGKGGVIQRFVLDSKGRSFLPKGLVMSKPVNGVSKFTVSLTKGTFATALADVGLVNQTLTAAPLVFYSNVYFNSKYLVCPRNIVYTAKAGKSGAATLKK